MERYSLIALMGDKSIVLMTLEVPLLISVPIYQKRSLQIPHLAGIKRRKVDYDDGDSDYGPKEMISYSQKILNTRFTNILLCHFMKN